MALVLSPPSASALAILHQLTRFRLAALNHELCLQSAGAPEIVSGCSRCSCLRRSFVGTESKRMLVFAEKVICLREFRKI